MHDEKNTIEEFLNAAAAKQPAPGGGSVTALVGALAASMGEMVINYSIGKKDLEPFIDELRPALAARRWTGSYHRPTMRTTNASPAAYRPLGRPAPDKVLPPPGPAQPPPAS